MLPGLSNVLRRDREKARGGQNAEGQSQHPASPPSGPSPIRREGSFSSSSGSIGFNGAFAPAGTSPYNSPYGGTPPQSAGTLPQGRRPAVPSSGSVPAMPPLPAGASSYGRPPPLPSPQHSMLPEEHRAMEKERERLARERLVAETSATSPTSSTRTTQQQQQQATSPQSMAAVPLPSSTSSSALGMQDPTVMRVSLGAALSLLFPVRGSMLTRLKNTVLYLAHGIISHTAAGSYQDAPGVFNKVVHRPADRVAGL